MHRVIVDGRPLSQSLMRVLPSGIRAINNQARALEARGERVIHLELGEPDFDTPLHIKAAASDALDAGMVHYTPNAGIAELRDAIAKSYEARGLKVGPSQVLVTNGASEAIYHALGALLNPGDEVMALTPAWVNYLQVPIMLGARTHCVNLKESNRFHPDLADMEAAITPATRVLLLNNPHNPTGAALSTAELRGMADFVCRHNLIVISDEIYEEIRYDGEATVPLASLPGMAERTVTISGASKTYAMTGWRIGWAVASKEIIEMMTLGRQYSSGSGPGFTQAGAVAGITGSSESVQAMVSEFARRRQLVYDRLNHIPGFSCLAPEGAFYCFVNITAFGRSADEMAQLLLERARVACVPGTAFGPGGEGYLRLSFATAYVELEAAMDRIEAATRGLTEAHVHEG